jgi:hypothetical protein
LRAISRAIVDGARPNLAAIARPDSPANTPREISSRSANDSRNGAAGRERDLTPPVLANKRCSDFDEQPTVVAATSNVSPSRTRC